MEPPTSDVLEQANHVSFDVERPGFCRQLSEDTLAGDLSTAWGSEPSPTGESAGVHVGFFDSGDLSAAVNRRRKKKCGPLRQNNSSSRSSRRSPRDKFAGPPSGRNLHMQRPLAANPTARLRQKVASAYSQCLHVALCRLTAADAHQIEMPSVKREASMQHSLCRYAWPHLSLPPMMWLPFSLYFSRDAKPLLDKKEKSKKKRQMRSLTTLEFTTSLDILKGRPREENHEKLQADAGKHQADYGDDVVLESCTKLREAFRVAVSETKLAQALSQAASREVHCLKADIERCKTILDSGDHSGVASGGKSRRPPPRAGGGAKAAAAAAGQPQVKAQLEAQQEHLRRLEASLKQELQDVAGQCQRLRAEIHRKKQRDMEESLMAIAAASTAMPSSATPIRTKSSASSRSRIYTKDVAAKFLTTARVLPNIGSPLPRQSNSGAQTARGRLETYSASQRNRMAPESNLPLIPWRAGTAP